MLLSNGRGRQPRTVRAFRALPLGPRLVSRGRRTTQVGRFIDVPEKRLARRAHLRAHRQTLGKVDHLARARGYGKVGRNFPRADPVLEATSLARRLPSGMTVYAVSPGGAVATKAVRNAGPALPETAASRYLQASELGTDISGHFIASAQGKFSSPVEGAAPAAPQPSRQSGSRVAGRRQGLRRRFLARLFRR